MFKLLLWCCLWCYGVVFVDVTIFVCAFDCAGVVVTTPCFTGFVVAKISCFPGVSVDISCHTDVVTTTVSCCTLSLLFLNFAISKLVSCCSTVTKIVSF